MVTRIIPKNDNQIPSLDDNKNYKNELTELFQKTSTEIQEYVSSLNLDIISDIPPLNNVFEATTPKILQDPEEEDGHGIKKQI